MAKLLLVQTGPGAPDLLPLEVWQALSKPHVFLAPDDRLGMRLADAEMPFTILDEAASENLRHEPATQPSGKGPELKLLISAHEHGEASPGARKVAERLADLAAERGEITFVLPQQHGEEITRAVLEKALTGEPEVEVVMGRSAPGARLLELVGVMARLRGPDGCPWDAEQTHETLVKYLLDETYELLEAIEAGTPDHIAEELGDLLLQVVFHAQMAADASTFDIDDVAGRLVTKLVTRHPHVFGDVEVEGSGEVVANWEVIKDHEKGRTSVLEGVPEALPALAYAHKLQKRAGKVGFDWDDPKGPAEKVREELDEVVNAQPSEIEEEVGDLLFAAVALGRQLGVDAETALRKAARTFRDRIGRMEASAEASNLRLKDLTAAELERLWSEAKR
ncbi:MAG: nucleoside triphosphate pyrophosphohydrolase [Actinomycetota bacterium]